MWDCWEVFLKREEEPFSTPSSSLTGIRREGWSLSSCIVPFAEDVEQ